MSDNYKITLNDETETAAIKYIAQILRQAQNGVTFSPGMVLANILIGLDLRGANDG